VWEIAAASLALLFSGFINGLRLSRKDSGIAPRDARWLFSSNIRPVVMVASSLP
jgi:hypothetical protein